MRRFTALALLAGFLCACSHQETALIPVAVPCPAPPVVTRPHLPTAELKADSSPDQVEKAFVASIEILKGYAAQLEKMLNGYRPGGGGK